MMMRISSTSIRPLADDIVRLASERGRPTVGQSLLAPIRRAARNRALSAALARSRRLSPGLEAREPQARKAFARLAGETLAAMKRDVLVQAREAGHLRHALARLDAWWNATTSTEHIDDETLDPAARRHAMQTLDRVNGVMGSYAAFFDLLGPALARVRNRPLRILDLAAGHGGFAVSVAREARVRGLAIDITASDIKSEYLEIAQQIAHAESLPVRVAVQDALNLSNLEPGQFDVVTCTQALHHFSPGAVATMLCEAAMVAAHSVVFIDGARTVLHAPPLYAYLRGFAGDPILAHDSWVSCRRFFDPEELALLARLGPSGDRAVAGWMRPNHCVVTISTASQPPVDGHDDG